MFPESSSSESENAPSLPHHCPLNLSLGRKLLKLDNVCFLQSPEYPKGQCKMGIINTLHNKNGTKYTIFHLCHWDISKHRMILYKEITSECVWRQCCLLHPDPLSFAFCQNTFIGSEHFVRLISLKRICSVTPDLKSPADLSLLLPSLILC